MRVVDALETPARSEERGVWTVAGRVTATDRVLEFFDGASDDIVSTTREGLLTEEVARSFAAASERGVSIRIAEMSESTGETIREAVPDVEPFESLGSWSDSPAGRLLMVDRTKTLASVLVAGDGDHPPDPRDETAIRGAGEANNLLVVLGALFTRQLDGTRQ